MKINRDELLALLQLVADTKPQEINCDEFLAHASGFLEHLVDANGHTPSGYEELRHHLTMCPECLEEFEALYQGFKDGL